MSKSSKLPAFIVLACVVGFLFVIAMIPKVIRHIQGRLFGNETEKTALKAQAEQFGKDTVDIIGDKVGG